MIPVMRLTDLRPPRAPSSTGHWSEASSTLTAPPTAGSMSWYSQHPSCPLIELREIADQLNGRHIHKDVTLIAAVPPQVKTDADRFGLTDTIEDAGGLVLEGVCFYQMRAREMAEANGWKRLMSNSAKLINILGGYDYEPFLGTMAQCVEAAIKGRFA